MSRRDLLPAEGVAKMEELDSDEELNDVVEVTGMEKEPESAEDAGRRRHQLGAGGRGAAPGGQGHRALQRQVKQHWISLCKLYLVFPSDSPSA